LLALDLLDGKTLLTPLLALNSHQENVFELLKTWTHGSHLAELLLDDLGNRLKELRLLCNLLVVVAIQHDLTCIWCDHEDHRT
jgi:hypothetical protein